MGLYNTVFADPDAPGQVVDFQSWKKAYGALNDVLSTRDSQAKIDLDKSTIRNFFIGDSASDEYFCWILAAFAPWATVPGPPKAGLKEPPPTAVTVARASIKAENRISNILGGAVKNFNEVSRMKTEIAHLVKEKANDIRSPLVQTSQPHLNDRGDLGMRIRRWGEHWRFHAALALLLDVTEADEASTGIGKKGSLVNVPRTQAKTHQCTKITPASCVTLTRKIFSKPIAYSHW